MRNLNIPKNDVILTPLKIRYRSVECIDIVVAT